MRHVMLCVAVVAWSCSKGADAGSAGSSAASSSVTPQGGAAATAPTGNATISGVVSFAGTPPANPKIDMSQESACASKYTTPPTEPEYVVANGKLANVFVYVKSGLPAGAKYPAPATPVVVDQSACEYHPRIFGVMVGQKVEIKNSDPLLHNIKAVPAHQRGFNISQPGANMTSSRVFDTEEVMVPLQCNVHGWMHAHVGVLSHPFFAVSGADGSFSIKGLPPGTYTIEAWHEKAGTQTTTVTIGAGETKTADFSFGTKA